MGKGKCISWALSGRQANLKRLLIEMQHILNWLCVKVQNVIKKSAEGRNVSFGPDIGKRQLKFSQVLPK